MPEKRLKNDLIKVFKSLGYKIYPNMLMACGIKYINNLLRNLKEEKCIIIFIVDDFEGPIASFPNQTIVRTSLNKSNRKYNEFPLPYMWDCLAMPFDPLPSTEKPIIGFCGLANKYRIPLMNLIEQNNNLDSNFVLRDKFWGGKPHDRQIISEYQNNIKSAHFTICNRGTGNFSMRFYHTLSAGRIPILLDTNILLPFEKIIDYDNCIIFGKTESELIDKIEYVWNSDEIINMQLNARRVYENYFIEENYAYKIIEQIEIKQQYFEWRLRRNFYDIVRRFI